MANRPPTLRYGTPDRAAYDRAYDVNRASGVEVKVRRGSRWRKLRALKIARDPLCEACKGRGLVVPADDVDHIEPIVRAPELAYVVSNLQSLCRSCHVRKTHAEGR